MTITFIGHGYVGLVTAAVFADLGNTVWCVGRTPKKIENLKKGIIPFFEPGLEEVVIRNINSGRLKFTLDYHQAVLPAKVVFICVGTPSKDNGEADLSSVFEAAKKIGKNLENYSVIVTKSTVPPGTNRTIEKVIRKENRKARFNISSIPEFLREGSALSDTLNPDRIVIGVEAEKAKKILLELHKPINGKFVITSIETAEMIKYAANAFLSTKISFANAMAFICEEVKADVVQVLDGVGLDKRIGREFLYPGVGFGGSCFPKDVKALINIAKNYGYDFKLLKAVDEINNQAWQGFVEKIIHSFKGNLKGKIIGVLGLSFKPNTDDTREAPSIKIINKLQSLGAKIKAYDPQATKTASKIFKNVVYCNNPYEVAKDASALLIITEWNEFRQLDFKRIKNLMKDPKIFDGRNIYEPKKIKNLGFKYQGVGR